MTKRSVAGVVLLSIITFGIYLIVWLVKTKNEANRAYNAGVPSAWWLIVPIGNIWWQWKFCKAVELGTRNKLSQVVGFILLALLSIIGVAIIQSKLNETLDEVANLPLAKVA